MKLKLDENLPIERSMTKGFGRDCGCGCAFAADRILFTLDKGIANLQRYPVHQHAGGSCQYVPFLAQ